MDSEAIIIEPPIRGYWTIYSPSGRPVRAYDFFAVGDTKILYKRGDFLKHMDSFFSAESTSAWSSHIYSHANGVVAEYLDGKTERNRKSFIYDFSNLLISKPKLFEKLITFKLSDGKVKHNGNWIEQHNCGPTNKVDYLFEQENTPKTH